MMSSVNHGDFAHLKIPLENVLSATNNFDDKNLIGGSDFGDAYKGRILWSGELINIDAQRLNKERDDKIEQQFWMEISMLSSLEHRNVVSFVGFCDENGEKIIINKYENWTSLDNLLSDPRLTWVRRLKISVGVAQVLSYIHYDESRDFSVIHQNIESETVLLNDHWEPKLSEFRLSMKMEASQRHDSFSVDKVWNREGYTDPTYIETKSAHHKSDIYSFGIVMFELMCGRKAVINDEDQDNKYLASVAVTHYREKKLDEIIDWDLWNQMDSQSFNIFAETAYDCLNEERSQHPNIDEIVTRLQKALELKLEHQNEIMNEFAHLRVPLENILSATNNFAEQNITGKSGFEKRYKGQLAWSGELIHIHARRWLNNDISDDEKEQCFWTEISMLYSLKHKNLVSLVGFCDENDEKIIIIKLENRGSLSNFLSDPMGLPWVRRLKISVSVAHALSYIHYDEPRDFSVIHRIINSGTIFLNDEWEPKLSHFEYSMKIKASKRHHSFHTNKLLYRNAYGDPTYRNTNSVSHKSDMYCFGVVLFELLCSIHDQDSKYLGPMAVSHCKKKILDEMIDPVLLKQMDPQSFNVFAKTAYDWLNEERSGRPDITEVVTKLKEALKLQLARENRLESMTFVSTNVEEISMLSSLKHKNLVSIIEFYDSKVHKIIGYKKEANGSLNDYLSDQTLTCMQRLKICVGVANALSYIHYDPGRDFSVVHCNIRSSNILLDDIWEPKLSGFELALKNTVARRHRLLLIRDIIVNVYLDPKYKKTGGVTHKSDVYSFGVVLFEVLCGRSAGDEDEYEDEDEDEDDDEDEDELREGLLSQLTKSHLDDMIDPHLQKQMDPESLKIVSETAYRCIKEERADRPYIDHVVKRLEKALEFQRKHENQELPRNAFDATSSDHLKGKTWNT